MKRELPYVAGARLVPGAGRRRKLVHVDGVCLLEKAGLHDDGVHLVLCIHALDVRRELPYVAGVRLLIEAHLRRELFNGDDVRLLNEAGLQEVDLRLELRELADVRLLVEAGL